MKLFGLILLISAALSIINFAQVHVAWESRYNSTGNGEEGGNAVYVDNMGNVYVTGYTGTFQVPDDIVTIKYDPNGNQQWAQTYGGAGDGDDAGLAVTVDDSGNVYVAGKSIESGTEADFILIKYNSSGVMQWHKTYNGDGNGTDTPAGIVIDNMGNIIVAGSSRGSGTGSDLAMFKYSPGGDSIWVKRFDGPAHGSDICSGIGIDDAGFIYLGGSVTSAGFNSDYLVVKYNSMGDTLWTAKYDGGSSDYSKSFYVDANGNSYITGQSFNASLKTDYATAKFDSAGVMKWTAIYDGSTANSDEGFCVKADDAGNVFVTGNSSETGGAFQTTIKYNSSGSEVWKSFYANASADGNLQALALDNNDNVYISGVIPNGVTGDWVTVKYDSSGNQLWDEVYNGTANTYDYVRFVTADNMGNCYVTGVSRDNVTLDDVTTLKYSETTDVQQIKHQPDDFTLEQNFPNPFNPETVISYQLSVNSIVTLKVYDVLGNEVATLVNEEKPAGSYEVNFSAENLSSGIYFYKLQSGNFSKTNKMILLK